MNKTFALSKIHFIELGQIFLPILLNYEEKVKKAFHKKIVTKNNNKKNGGTKKNIDRRKNMGINWEEIFDRVQHIQF
jgi:hypothetical protein